MTDEFTACLGCNETLGIGQSEYCPRCRVSMVPTNANDWPANQRGDLRQCYEGWEEMDLWFTASRIQPAATNDDKSLGQQLEWLADIRSGKWKPRGRNVHKKSKKFLGP